MEFKFSNRISSLKPSAIREILKLSSDPSVIPFSAGNPSVKAFPADEIRAITADILGKRAGFALQYGITEGYKPLRESLTELCRTRYGSYREGDELIVTTGAQQAIDLAAKCLLNEGDRVVAEGPSFVGALSAFKSFGANVVQVELCEDGMDIDALDAAAEGAKLIYVIPNFQNPAGLTTSLEKRRLIYETARKHDCIIIEDNPYGDLRFRGEDIACIKSMDTDGRVIYLGSFSKLLSPGLRVGYACGPAALIAKMAVVKQTEDVHTALLNQMICDEYMRRYSLTGHIDMLRRLYREKSELMQRSFEREFGGVIEFTHPDGGLFVWCTLPKGVDMMAFCGEAVKRGVAVVPGTAFYADDSVDTPCFRCNFSSPADEQIERGAAILGKLVKEIG